MSEPKLEALMLRYQELQLNIRTAFDLFLKGSALTIAFYGASIGYLLTIDLSKTHARLICLINLLILLFYDICCILAVKIYQ